MNGKKYDAKTGALLHDAQGKSHKPQSIDGFTTHVSSPTIVKPTAVKPAPIVSKPGIQDIVRTPAKHATKQQQGSKTLMRHAVAKPGVSKPIKAHHALAKPATNLHVKQSVHTPDHRRSVVAQHVPRSSAIKKFAPIAMHKNPSQLYNLKPIEFKPAVHKPVAPHKPSTADMLHRAIEHATGHEEIYEPAKKFAGSRRAMSLAAAATALFLIIGFAGLQSVTPIKVRVASSKAGFNIATPAYQPSGFSLSNLSYAAGNAGLHYTSNSDDRAFSIIQKSSQWDSTTLRSMVVEKTGNEYQTVESAGRTIFLDENKTANWVNGGVWYQVQNENALSDKQIIDIANSL